MAKNEGDDKIVVDPHNLRFRLFMLLAQDSHRLFTLLSLFISGHYIGMKPLISMCRGGGNVHLLHTFPNKILRILWIVLNIHI